MQPISPECPPLGLMPTIDMANIKQNEKARNGTKWDNIQNISNVVESDKRSHCSVRGIVTDDQVRNFVDSQINLYHLIRDRPEFYKLKLQAEKNSKISDRKFRSHRGLTGLYSAIKATKGELQVII